MLESRFQVNLFINGQDWGIWDKKSGGEVTAELKSYQPGGANVDPIVESNKKKAPDDVELSRYYSVERDHARRAELFALVGSGDCVVVEQPLDGEDNPLGDPIPTQGKLMACTPPDIDSESDDTAMVSIKIKPVK